MRTVWMTWRRESRKHPSILALTYAGLCGLAVSASLIGAGMALVGYLVAGIAVVPLALVVYLCGLLAAAWPEDDAGWGFPGDDDEPGPGTPPTPGGGVDWAGFEREFWAYVDARVPVG